MRDLTTGHNPPILVGSMRQKGVHGWRQAKLKGAGGSTG